MNNLYVAIIAGGSAVLGAIAGGFFSVWAAKIAHNNDRLNSDRQKLVHDVNELCDQISGYYILEKAYLDHICTEETDSAHKMKMEIRNRARTNGGHRITMTDRSADVKKKEWSRPL